MVLACDQQVHTLREFYNSAHGAITRTRSLGSQSKLGKELKKFNNHRGHPLIQAH